MSEIQPIYPIAGARLAAVAAGIRYQNRQDLVLMELAATATTAAVFTRNAFAAAPVQVAREHLQNTAHSRYLLINSGNANAGTGIRGLADARACCQLLADLAQCQTTMVLPFSTGVIGMDLPVERFQAALPQSLSALSENGWEMAARAIMTTDTRPKISSQRLLIEGTPVHLTGIAKGAGMICPDMATMLAFVATDAAIPAALLQQALRTAVADSFNAITVDGDTSTNDACVLSATGQAGIAIAQLTSPAGQAFQTALNHLCADLASQIIADAEGGTKQVSIQVEEAGSITEARQVAYAVAHSPLVKTAWFASDPNWGRILAAVGRSGLPQLDIGKIRIWLDEVLIVAEGGRHPDYTEAQGQRIFGQPTFGIRIVLGRGAASARILTCDLSHDYVRINAEYRS